MRSTRLPGLPFWHGFVSIALLCGACSSDSPDSESAALLPAYSGANDAPGSTTAGTEGSADSAGEPAAPAAMEPTPSSPTPASTTSETPTNPQLVPAAPPDTSTSSETGMTGTAPAAPPAGPEPSARCGSGGASPAFNLPNTLFSVPASYDGVTPLPVVLAFHAAGNPNTQLRTILGATLDDQYIVLYPKSDGNGWSNGVDSPKVDAMFAALDALACYDKSRVFATGHSSGAQFIVQRLCAGESRWRAVAPVASSVYCSSWTPIPALVIHGIGDTERQAYGLDDGDGLKDIVPYRTSNGCQETFSELPVAGCSSGGVQVSPGCRQFDGCGETTRWCQHDDPQYGTSHHGVPCFGARVIKDFFDTVQ